MAGLGLALALRTVHGWRRWLHGPEEGEATDTKGRILLTGFEVFDTHTVNPSWEVMKELDGVVWPGDLVSTARLLPVAYDDVERLVAALWDEFPDAVAMVHCGVGRPHCVYLERRARNGPYIRLDNKGATPPSERARPALGRDHALASTVDVDAILQAVRGKRPGVLLSGSDNAGLYLCEYTLFQSLSLGRAPSVFVHLPPYGLPYSHEELLAIVRDIVTGVAAQVSEQPAANNETPSRPKVGVGVFVTSVSHPNCVLLGRRLTKHTDGNPHGKDTFALPGGHVEFGESFEECAAREVLEECGLALTAVRLVGVLNVVEPRDRYHYVVPVLHGRCDGGEPEALEPDKCSEWFWHDWSQPLPLPVFSSLQAIRDAGLSPF